MFRVVDHLNPAPFSVTTACDGSDVVVAPRGELDIAAEEQFTAALKDVLASRPRLLSVDLRELDFLDSTGLRSLLRVRDECQRHGCRLLLVRGKPAVQRAFDVSGLTPHFAIVEHSDPEQALEATG